MKKRMQDVKKSEIESTRGGEMKEHCKNPNQLWFCFFFVPQTFIPQLSIREFSSCAFEL
jgi:hypothetical protein